MRSERSSLWSGSSAARPPGVTGPVHSFSSSKALPHSYCRDTFWSTAEKNRENTQALILELSLQKTWKEGYLAILKLSINKSLNFSVCISYFKTSKLVPSSDIEKTLFALILHAYCIYRRNTLHLPCHVTLVNGSLVECLSIHSKFKDPPHHRIRYWKQPKNHFLLWWNELLLLNEKCRSTKRTTARNKLRSCPFMMSIISKEKKYFILNSGMKKRV